MGFLNRFVKSVYKFDEYGELVKLSLRSSLFYYFVVSVITVAASCFAVSPVITQIFDSVEENIPEFKIEGGELVTDEPYYYMNNGIAAVMDPECDDVYELAEEYSAVNGFFVGKNTVLVRNAFLGGDSVEELSDFEGFTSDDAEALIGLVRKLTYFILAGTFIFLKILLLIFVWCIAKLMSNIFRGGLNMKESLKLGIYACTLPVILKTVFYFTSISLPNMIFYALILVYCYFGIKSSKAMRIEA